MKRMHSDTRAEKTYGMTMIVTVALCLVLAGGCTPTIKVETPDKPIEINMNIKIEQEVRVKIEKDLESIMADDPELFGVSPQKEPQVQP